MIVVIFIQKYFCVRQKSSHSGGVLRWRGEDRRFKNQYADIACVEILVKKIIDVDIILSITLTVS